MPRALTGDGGSLTTAGHTGRADAVALLLGADACARLAGAAVGAPTPAPAVPDLVAVALRLLAEPAAVEPTSAGTARGGTWQTTWNDAEHAAAVEQVRAAIARGDVYQVNVVGHRLASWSGDPLAAVRSVLRLPGASYAGVITGEDWVVASASPERLLEVAGGRLTSGPIKGTRPATAVGAVQLRGSTKDRAEHVMIVDLVRNDLARVAVTGSVGVDELYRLRNWSGLWQAESTVSAQLTRGVGLVEVLRAICPGGSVTGAPKLAALDQIAALEPVGRGPSMGALGLLRPGRLSLGLTIRTVAVTAGSVHLWAGGGITWNSDPVEEVAEAHAKATPLMAALTGPVP